MKTHSKLGCLPRGLSLLGVFIWALSGVLRAHDLPYARLLIEQSEAGEIEISIATHVPAYVLNAPIGHLSDIDLRFLRSLSDDELAERVNEATGLFSREFYFALDGREIAVAEISFPDLGSLREDAAIGPDNARPSTPIRLTLQRGDARALTLAAPYRLGSLMVMHGAGGEAVAPQFVAAGELSRAIDLANEVDPIDILKTFFLQGIVHILPLGLDHILFVVLLALISTRLTSMVLLVSAFTLAHTLTLAFAVLGSTTIPATLVEPLIALSIVVMALMNLVAAGPGRGRLLVVAGFGLLHGLGFAGALRDLGLPRGQEFLALLAFNLGVEVAQLAVVAAVLLLMGWYMRRHWYRRAIVTPASIVIALVGATWTLERTGFVL